MSSLRFASRSSSPTPSEETTTSTLYSMSQGMPSTPSRPEKQGCSLTIGEKASRLSSPRWPRPRWSSSGASTSRESSTMRGTPRSMRSHLSDMVRLMGWVATIDSFQQWVYTHPDHSRDERSEFWVGVQERYGVGESWEGYEEAGESYWQR